MKITGSLERTTQEIDDMFSNLDDIVECIAFGKNIDGTLDCAPLPLAMKNIWLFNNGGERNDVY
jgi:hypothetical protein